ncbi:MAG: S8 family serine peptidase [Planctomycetota bacterium]
MSIAGGLATEPSAAWTPSVDAAWFEQLAPASKTGPLPAPLGLDSLPSGPQVGRLEEAIDPTSSRWVVQLTPEATRRAGSVAGVVDVLAPASVETQIIGGLGLEGMVLLETRPGADPASVETWLGGNPLIAYAEPDSLLTTQALPDDGGFSNLWGLHNTGQTGGTADADIDAPEAWDLSTGSSSIVVGVIDTGVDYTHPDLAANIWTNPNEVSANGIDDDGNGFIDDVHGYDFANGDGDPMDDNGHGTHVSGTIAGVGDNGQGVAGVNWTGSVMALKFLDGDGNGFTSAAVAALNYATMMRSIYGIDVRVTNNSWGGGGYSQALYDAVRASGDAGMLFVAAAGNDGVDADSQAHYPSGYDLANVIAVAATDANDNLAAFSNYGLTSIDLGAPGVGIYSTLPGGAYGSYSGTSMATPHVAGVAALAWATAANASVQQVRDAMLGGVDPVGALVGRVATGGRLNARGALEELSISVLASDPAAESVLSSPPVDFTIQFTHAYDPGTVDAADLVVNGIPADSVTIVNAKTATFRFNDTPVTVEGPQAMEIGSGTILRAADGDPISAWRATFYYDLLPSVVISTMPAEGGVVAAPPTQIVLDFNEPIDPQSVGPGDLLLSVGSVTAAAMLDSDSVAYTVSGLPREADVTYTLRERAIRDAHGTPGGAYVGHFTIDDPLIERYTSGNVPANITDYSTITSTLVINESFAIADVDVEVDITHTYDADLDVTLIAPNGTRVTLFSSVGGSANDFSGTILDDEAETAIAGGQPPFSGRYRPQQPLSAVDGLDVAGTWTLEVADHGGRDEGTLNAWGIVVERGAALPPRILSVNPLPPDGGEAVGTLDDLVVRFSKAMDPATVNDAGSWVLAEAGPDALFDTADDVDFPLAVSPPYASGLTATLATGLGLLPEGSYRFTAASGGLVDLSGTPLDGNSDGADGDPYVTHFTVLPRDWFPSGDVPKNITDDATVTSTLTVNESFPIADLDVKIDIAHTYDADLDVFLIAPDGTRIELFTDVGVTGDDFSGTILDDEADTAIVDGVAPFSGRYRPEGLLSVVDGTNARGTWTLEITDDGAIDKGTLNSWALIVERAPVIPPRILSIDPLPADGGEIFGPVNRLQVDFSAVMNPTSLNEPSHWELRAPGADALFETADDVSYSLAVFPPYVSGLTATLVPDVGHLPAGSYRLTAASGGLLDHFDTPLDGDSDGTGGDDYVTHFTLLPRHRYAAGDVPQSIADFSTIASTVTVDESVLIADVDVELNITHTYDRDLDVFLIAPDGTRIELFTDVGGSNNHFRGTVLDDEAATPVGQGSAPFRGSYQPEGSLAVLDGFDARGTWTLEVTDDAGRDVGTLDGWALLIDPVLPGPPRIVGHLPDTVTPAPIETVRIEFDRPMNPLSFSLADDVLSFVGPQGSILPTASTWLDPQTLDIGFDPQGTPGEYSLVLSPQILSAAGLVLDQDGDSLPGEIPDDRYMAEFTLAQPLGAVASLEFDHLDPSAGDLWYHFQTTRKGSLTVQANFQVGLGSVAVVLYDANLDDPPVAISTPTYGNRRIDHEVAGPGEVYYLKLTGTNADVDLRLANLLSREGDTVIVYGTDGADRFEFEAAASHHVTVNQLRYEFDPAEVSRVTFDGGAGNDAVVFRGSADDETVELWPDRGTLDGLELAVSATGVESFTSYGGGGTDVAMLHDDPATKDTLEATPDSARFYGAGFDHQLFSFRYVHAYATEGGDDVARLYDDPGGQDRFKATPSYGTLYGSGFYNRALSFDRVYAYATDGGTDIAVLYDDPAAPDTFEATPSSAFLSGNGFYHEAVDFRDVHAYATEGGGDVARLYDDPGGQDRFQATPRYGTLYGSGFYNRAVSFDRVYAYATDGGTDIAVLYDDPAGKDAFQGTPGSAELYGNGFANQAVSFRYVFAYATPGGDDEAHLYDSQDNDVFEAAPDYGKLYGPGFYLRAKSFRHVTAHATGGDDDRAYLFDSALDDLLEAQDNWARLSNAVLGFANMAMGFERVEATSTNDGDSKAVDPAVDFLFTDPPGPW